MQYKTNNLREAIKWLIEGKVMTRYCNDKCIGVVRFDPMCWSYFKQITKKMEKLM